MEADDMEVEFTPPRAPKIDVDQWASHNQNEVLMGCVVDRADKYTSMEIDIRIREIRSGMDKNESMTHCEDCGDPIPERRRQAVPGCTRCVECQEALEKSK